MTELPPPQHNPRRESSMPSISSAQFGMYIFLASLGVLFAASLVAYVVTRWQSTVWRTAEMPALPTGLLASTGLLIGVSVALWSARRAARQNRFRSIVRGLALGLAGAVGFLMAQVQNWRTMAASALPTDTQSLYAFTFYMLTALHAVHVVGGLIPLVLTLKNAQAKHYTSSRHEGLKLCIQYWDFLLVVWMILFVALELA